MKNKANVVICPPCGESVTQATKEGQNKGNTLWPLLPRLMAVLPPQGREMSHGFTLIELLVVVIITAILAAVAVPQYQQAVLKSRYKTLMLPTKSIHANNEVYFLSNGYYANKLAELDVDFNDKDKHTIISLNDDPEYAYIVSTRKDIDNNYIMYQKNSINYPAEIHCEALTKDTRANQLCKNMGGEKITGSITPGYTTYVLQGTGNGMAPGANFSCDKALAMGYTCEITAKENGGFSKKTCYQGVGNETVGTNSLCVTAEYSKDNVLLSKTACRIESNGYCVEQNKYYYDENENIIEKTSCRQWQNGKCLTSGGTMYTYDANGNITSARSCNTWFQSDGSCPSVKEQGTVYEYDANGNLTARKSCDSFKQDNTCASYAEQKFTEYTYDDKGNKLSERICAKAKTDGSCAEYQAAYGQSSPADQYDYVYDKQGNLLSQRQCFTVGENGTCQQWASIDNVNAKNKEYTYDEDGRLLTSYTCNYRNDDGSCKTYGWGYSYEYDNDGTRIELRCPSLPCSNNRTNISNIDVYDEQGNKTANISCTSSSSDSYSYHCSSYTKGTWYEYDTKGNVIAERNCSSINLSTRTCSNFTRTQDAGYYYTYDNAGRLLSKKVCKTSNSSGTCTEYDLGTYYYTYNEKGTLISTRYCTPYNSGRVDPNTGECTDWTGINQWKFTDSLE